MKTIHMGLNTEPAWIDAELSIERWRNDTICDEEYRVARISDWEKSKVSSIELKTSIEDAVAEYGKVSLSWSCIGRTRHCMLAYHWSEAMPEYHFEITDNYGCVVTKK